MPPAGHFSARTEKYSKDARREGGFLQRRPPLWTLPLRKGEVQLCSNAGTVLSLALRSKDFSIFARFRSLRCVIQNHCGGSKGASPLEALRVGFPKGRESSKLSSLWRFLWDLKPVSLASKKWVFVPPFCASRKVTRRRLPDKQSFELQTTKKKTGAQCAPADIFVNFFIYSFSSKRERANSIHCVRILLKETPV